MTRALETACSLILPCEVDCAALLFSVKFRNSCSISALMSRSVLNGLHSKFFLRNFTGYKLWLGISLCFVNKGRLFWFKFPGNTRRKREWLRGQLWNTQVLANQVGNIRALVSHDFFCLIPQTKLEYPRFFLIFHKNNLKKLSILWNNWRNSNFTHIRTQK